MSLSFKSERVHTESSPSWSLQCVISISMYFHINNDTMKGRPSRDVLLINSPVNECSQMTKDIFIRVVTTVCGQQTRKWILLSYLEYNSVSQTKISHPINTLHEQSATTHIVYIRWVHTIPERITILFHCMLKSLSWEMQFSI